MLLPSSRGEIKIAKFQYIMTPHVAPRTHSIKNGFKSTRRYQKYQENPWLTPQNKGKSSRCSKTRSAMLSRVTAATLVRWPPVLIHNQLNHKVFHLTFISVLFGNRFKSLTKMIMNFVFETFACSLPGVFLKYSECIFCDIWAYASIFPKVSILIILRYMMVWAIVVCRRSPKPSRSFQIDSTIAFCKRFQHDWTK